MRYSHSHCEFRFSLDLLLLIIPDQELLAHLLVLFKEQVSLSDSFICKLFANAFNEGTKLWAYIIHAIQLQATGSSNNIFITSLYFTLNYSFFEEFFSLISSLEDRLFFVRFQPDAKCSSFFLFSNLKYTYFTHKYPYHEMIRPRGL